MKKTEYPVGFIDYIRDMAKGRPRKESYEMTKKKFPEFGLTFPQFKKVMYVNGIKAEYNAGRFVKGRTPCNKGNKASDETRRKQSLAHMGRLPWKYKEIGSVILNRDKQLVIKINNTRDKTTDWMPIKNLVWEMHNGKVPEGYIITVLDGDNTNLHIDNLEMISRAENAVLNKHNMRYNDTELSRTALHLARLRMKLRHLREDKK